MAFLDNSGDIILDAVLTEEGRRRMANGNFNISKFAFGDDEINYGLYDKSHASGSAYYDLEILQTPVMQAPTGRNANINFGLLSYTNPNLMYMPTMRVNTKVPQALELRDKIYYIAVNDGTTYSTLKLAFGQGGEKRILLTGQTNGTKIFIETGVDTEEITGTPNNRTSYLVANGLVEDSFSVSIDKRFIAGVMGPRSGGKFTNKGGSGSPDISMKLISAAAATPDPARSKGSISKVKGLPNNVSYRINDKMADTETSAIKGPRASVTAINFLLRDIPDSAWNNHGKTGQSISGASGTYKYIDTMVKIVSSTGLVDQLPLRIIQKEA